MGNRLPTSGIKKNTIVPSNTGTSEITNQFTFKNDLQRQHTISERSDQKERNENLLFISNNAPPTSSLELDGSTSSKRSHSSKNSSRRSTSRTPRVHLSNRTPALSFKQHPSSRITIEPSEEMTSHHSYQSLSLDDRRSERAKEMVDVLSIQPCPLGIVSLDLGYDEMSQKMSFRTELTSAMKNNFTSSIDSTMQSIDNVARRDVITGIITIPASSLSSQNLKLAQENMICGLLTDDTNSLANSPRSFGEIDSVKESSKRPSALPAHLYSIKDNSDHDLERSDHGVMKNIDDDEGDYFVGGALINPLFT
jgi:hypothetical protein